jgi:hypothetical protein
MFIFRFTSSYLTIHNFLHQECPLACTDEWRSYSFQLLSGWLRFLYFEVVDNLKYLIIYKLPKVFLQHQCKVLLNYWIAEYLQTGMQVWQYCYKNLTLINEVLRCIHTLMKIWGVGWMGSLDLLNARYHTIRNARNAVKIGLLWLAWRITQNYVEFIADKVFQAVRECYPSAELIVTGCYWRVCWFFRWVVGYWRPIKQCQLNAIIRWRRSIIWHSVGRTICTLYFAKKLQQPDALGVLKIYIVQSHSLRALKIYINQSHSLRALLC